MPKKQRLLNNILLFTTIYISFCASLFSQDKKYTRAEIDTLIYNSFDKIIDEKFEDAFNDVTNIMNYGKEVKNDCIIGTAYRYYGLINDFMSNIERAKEDISLSIEHLKKGNYQESLSSSYNNLGMIYEQLNDTLSAEKYYLLANKYTKDIRVKVIVKLNLGFIKYYNGVYPEAEKYMNDVIYGYTPPYHQAHVYISAQNILAKIEIERKNYTKALNYLHKSDSLAKNANDIDYMLRIEKIKSNIHSKTNNSLNLSKSLKKQVELLEKLKNRQVEKLKENNALLIELAEKNNAITFANKINENQKKTILKTRIFIISISLLFIASSIFLFLFQKSNKTKKMLNKALTERNKRLIEAKEKTEYASNLKQNFFSTISHELRTPLYAVTGITDILIKENTDDNQKDLLEKLKSSGEHLLSLINNVLQINKYDSQKTELSLANFNLRNLTKNIHNTLDLLAKENNNHLTIEVDDNIPEILNGDELKIKQVLINLINNSLKFTHNGTIKLHIKTIKQTQSNILLNFSVKDTGIGISKDMQKKIFEDFYQESMQLERNFEGTGLGLPIVKRLLNIMNSDIKLISTLNKGSTFYFDLTLDIQKNNTESDKNLIANSLTHKSLENKKFLVVDDNAINQMITKRLLEEKKVKVTIVDNGFDAIEKTKNNDYDVILMDIHMPRMNGHDAAKKIREFNTKTPIIALTALKIDDNKSLAIESGMNDVIVKPFVVENFFNTIKSYV